ncbi:MAG: pilin [bacterium]
MTGRPKNHKIISFLAAASIMLSGLLPIAARAECAVAAWGGVCGCEGAKVGDACGPEGFEGTGICVRVGEQLVCPEATTEDATQTDEPTTQAATRDLVNPLGGDVTLQEIFARIISVFTAISGSMALLMFVYGGVLWLTSNGDPGRVESGRKSIVWAIIGLVVIFGAYAILRAIFVALGGSGIV